MISLTDLITMRMQAKSIRDKLQTSKYPIIFSGTASRILEDICNVYDGLTVMIELESQQVSIIPTSKE